MLLNNGVRVTSKSRATEAKNKLTSHQTKGFSRGNKIVSKLKDSIRSGESIEIIWLIRRMIRWEEIN